MKIRTLIGLAAIGGVAYAHNKRGGEWTLDGIKETLRQLFASVQDKLEDFAEEAKQQLSHEKDITPEEMGTRGTGYGVGGSDVTGYNR
jgi:hypothetical protein